MARRKQWTRKGPRYRRRSVLLGAGALVSFSGCLGIGGHTDTDAPAAVTPSDTATCDVCGMVIYQHPGPTAEIFYASHSPNGHDNPAQFDTTWEAYQYYFRQKKQGWERTAFYVTDYSSVEYEISKDGGNKSITRYLKKDVFALVDAVTYVVGSSVHGAMGKDLIAFTSKEDAKSFQSKYGGKLAPHDEVTPDVIASFGG